MSSTALQACKSLRDPTSNMYTWVYRDVLDSNFNSTGPIPPGGALPANTIYALYDVTISPPPALQQAHPTSQTDVRVLLNKDPANTGNVHPNYDGANVQNFAMLVAAVLTAIPRLGISKSADNQFSVEAFMEFVETKYYQCAFLIAASVFRRAVVGAGPLRKANQCLQELKQTRKINGKDIIMSVQAYFDRFVQIVNEKPANQPFGNITNTFIHGLDPQIQSFLVSQLNYNPPTMGAGNNLAEMDSLLNLKEEAFRAETTLKQQYNQALSVLNQARGGRGNANNSILATHNQGGSDPVMAFMGRINPSFEAQNNFPREENNINAYMGSPSHAPFMHPTQPQFDIFSAMASH